MKKLLFSITKKDFEFQYFRSGGSGGQNQNKVNSGVRIIHKDSGAVGEARDSRDQHQNKKAAFLRLVNSDKFKAWHKIETMKRLGKLAIAEENVKKMMLPNHLKIEVVNDDGKWTEAKESELQ
jgi:protein subunit release factor B